MQLLLCFSPGEGKLSTILWLVPAAKRECMGVPNPSGSTLVGCKWLRDGKALWITELSWLAQEEKPWRTNSPFCWMMKFSLKDRFDPWVGWACVACPDSDVSSSAGWEFSEETFFIRKWWFSKQKLLLPSPTDFGSRVGITAGGKGSSLSLLGVQ